MADSSRPSTGTPTTGGSVDRDHGLAFAKGTRLGELELEAVLGEGGFAIVYLAFDHSLHRRIAVKEYLPGAYAYRRDDGTIGVRSGQHAETFSSGLRSFLQEARLLASFEHPALVRVHRFWEANGTAYMAMRHYQGRTLRDTLKADARFATEARLKELATPLLDAVSMLHAESCFHRDISPDNIIIQGDGRPVLLDFGAARRIIGELTHVLTAVLKPGYAPIEQYADEDAGFEQGPWTDVYGFAATLHCAITGKPPPTAVTRIVNDRYASLAAQRPDGYSLPFLRAIDSGLAVLPANRVRSIEDLRAALFAVEEHDDEKTVTYENEKTVRMSRPGPVKSVPSTLPAAAVEPPTQRSIDERGVSSTAFTIPCSPASAHKSKRAASHADGTTPTPTRDPAIPSIAQTRPKPGNGRLIVASACVIAVLAVATATWYATRAPSEAATTNSEPTPSPQAAALTPPSRSSAVPPQAPSEASQAAETVPSVSKAQSAPRQSAVPPAEPAIPSTRPGPTGTFARASPSTRVEAPPHSAGSTPSPPAARPPSAGVATPASPASVSPSPPVATPAALANVSPSPAVAAPALAANSPAVSNPAAPASSIPVPSTAAENAIEPKPATAAAPKEESAGKAGPSVEPAPTAPPVAVGRTAPAVASESRPTIVAAAKPAITGRCNCNDLRETCSASSRRDAPSSSATGTWRVDIVGRPSCAVIEYRDHRGGPIVREQVRNGWGIVSVSPMLGAVPISGCHVCAME
jgi:serine/threonine protein kinase